MGPMLNEVIAIGTLGSTEHVSNKTQSSGKSKGNEDPAKNFDRRNYLRCPKQFRQGALVSETADQPTC
jgi:hypothetical protein